VTSLRIIVKIIYFAAGFPTVASAYGYSNAGIVAYNVTCNGTESRIEDCDRFPGSSPFCDSEDPSMNAAGVVCVSTGRKNFIITSTSV
jgi:hypothetical protein